MAGEDRPLESDIDEVSARLTDALKTCRSVVANYKALLTNDQAAAEDANGTPSGGDSTPLAVPDADATDER